MAGGCLSPGHPLRLLPAQLWAVPAPPHLAGTAWSCPRIRVTCAIPNPPNKCDSSWQCPRHQKCCQGACGRRCLSRPPGIPTSHGTVLSEPPAVAVALGREVATGFQGWGWPRCSLSAPLPLSFPFPSVRARLLRIPVPPPVPARCSQPGEDCPAGDRDGDSSLPTL
uniref:WAP domain-containing protein n=1 Tax=Anas platyrhynchos TaxID=8839 RepID=A0A8B9T1Q4_ANAPL